MPEKSSCELENRGECTIPKQAIICTKVPNFAGSMKPR